MNDTTSVKVPLETSRLSKDSNGIDFFVRMWVRVLSEGTVIEVPNAVSCSITAMRMQCVIGGKALEVELGVNVGNQVVMLHTWMHIALSGSVQQNQSYLSVYS